MIYVTHDQVEAMTMADRIVIMNAGNIEQVGDPLTIYYQPANLFVAGFIGTPKMNFLPVGLRSRPDGVALLVPGGSEIAVPPMPSMPRIEEGILGVRAEHIHVSVARSGLMPGTIRLVEHLGSETLLHIDAGLAENLIAKDAGLSQWRSGDTVGIALDSHACHVFDPAGPVLYHSGRPDPAP
jgi:multiple sugar transport system ATP-binding protein